jgi:hypothetical protein
MFQPVCVMSLPSTVHKPTIRLLTPASCDSDYTTDSGWKSIYLALSPFIYMCSLAFTMVHSQPDCSCFGSLVHSCHGLSHWSCHLLLGFISSHSWLQALWDIWPYLCLMTESCNSSAGSSMPPFIGLLWTTHATLPPTVLQLPCMYALPQIWFIKTYLVMVTSAWFQNSEVSGL